MPKRPFSRHRRIVPLPQKSSVSNPLIIVLLLKSIIISRLQKECPPTPSWRLSTTLSALYSKRHSFRTALHWRRGRALVARLLLLFLPLVSACAPLIGFPSDPTDTQAAADQQLVTEYYSLQEPEAGRQLLRNQIVSGRMNAYEAAYSNFKRRLNGDANTINLVSDLSILGLAGVAATTGSLATATALAAASAGIIGAKGAINSDLYFQRTLPALLAQMDANRARAKLPIVTGLRKSNTDYPLAIAFIDLDALRDAGGIPGAIGGLTQQAEVQKADAERVLGFNTTSAAACLQKFIDKPDPEGSANKALVASKARAFGARFSFVTEWVTDPKTDPNQLAAVANAIGCTGP